MSIWSCVEDTYLHSPLCNYHTVSCQCTEQVLSFAMTDCSQITHFLLSRPTPSTSQCFLSPVWMISLHSALIGSYASELEVRWAAIFWSMGPRDYDSLKTISKRGLKALFLCSWVLFIDKSSLGFVLKHLSRTEVRVPKSLSECQRPSEVTASGKNPELEYFTYHHYKL
jgi:hypothetical protein